MRYKVIGSFASLGMTVGMFGMTVESPTGGMGQPKVAATICEAFSPVVTSVWHSGIRASKAGISVVVTTSRKASEALSFNLRTSQAVS